MGKFMSEYKMMMNFLADNKGNVDYVDLERSVLNLEGYLFELKFKILDRIDEEMIKEVFNSDLVLDLSRSYDLLGRIDFNKLN